MSDKERDTFEIGLKNIMCFLQIWVDNSIAGIRSGSKKFSRIGLGMEAQVIVTEVNGAMEASRQ